MTKNLLKETITSRSNGQYFVVLRAESNSVKKNNRLTNILNFYIIIYTSVENVSKSVKIRDNQKAIL